MLNLVVRGVRRVRAVRDDRGAAGAVRRRADPAAGAGGAAVADPGRRWPRRRRSGVSTAAGWAQSRLEPQVDQVVEVRLYDLTSQVELAAFDDPDFHDRLQRARDRGV